MRSTERRVCVMSEANTNPLLAIDYEPLRSDLTSPIRKEDSGHGRQDDCEDDKAYTRRG